MGAYLVGLDFNPSGDATVGQIKILAAQLLNLCNELKISQGKIPEKSRLASLAMTNIEQGAMWAVKAATKKPFEAPVASSAVFTAAPAPTTVEDAPNGSDEAEKTA